MTGTVMPQLLMALLLLAPLKTQGQVRSSTNYSVEAETFDGGGGLSGSADYSDEGSLEPLVSGESESTRYTILHGFVTAITAANLSGYDTWTQARGLTEGVNAGYFDDPNEDGRPNLNHFAFDTDPLGNGTEDGKCKLGVVNIGGQDYLTLTLPVRTGAVFSGNPLRSNVVDGITYEILGDDDLDDPWDLEVVEVIPALEAGLPILGDFNPPAGGDWQYRTFRPIAPQSDLPRFFIKADVSPEP